MAKYLDSTGVQTLWTAVKEQDATNLAAAKNYTDGKDNAMGSRVSTLEGYFTSGVANEAAKATKDGNNDVISSTYVKANTKGQANGVCPLDANAKVAAAYLPGYVDDIIEGYYYQNKFYEESTHTTEISGEGGKLYVDLSTNTTYRWSGTQFTMVSESISIGTTQGTAYDGGLGAGLASDVSNLQTTVNAIPNTYVPKSSGTNKGNITNSTSEVSVAFNYRKLKLDDFGIALGVFSSNTQKSGIYMDAGYGFKITSYDLEWQPTDGNGNTSGTVKEIATTDQIPAVEAITSTELAAILV